MLKYEVRMLGRSPEAEVDWDYALTRNVIAASPEEAVMDAIKFLWKERRYDYHNHALVKVEVRLVS